MANADPLEPRRRDVISIAALSFVGVGLAAAAWPFIAQMAPNRASRRGDLATVELDGIAEGTTRVVAWNGLPVLVRHRPRVEIEAARRSSGQIDGLARNALQPRTADSRDAHRVGADPRWLVMVGLCSKHDCLVRDMDTPSRLADGVGWFCPCCASRYDLSGRVVSGPAPANLAVPRHEIRGGSLTIGPPEG
jgi:ubiquinol-cytochrome c reductase iron-sulfur subunit